MEWAAGVGAASAKKRFIDTQNTGVDGMPYPHTLNNSIGPAAILITSGAHSVAVMTGNVI